MLLWVKANSRKLGAKGSQIDASQLIKFNQTSYELLIQDLTNLFKLQQSGPQELGSSQVFDRNNFIQTKYPISNLQGGHTNLMGS